MLFFKRYSIISIYFTIKTLLLSPSFTCIRIYGKVFSFSDHPRFLGYFSSFDELNAEKKNSHSSTRMAVFCLCYCKLYLFNPVFGLFCRPRITDIRLRKSFQKRPIGNITVCHRKSPVFGIYIIARLYDNIFLRFSCAVFPYFF